MPQLPRRMMTPNALTLWGLFLAVSALAAACGNGLGPPCDRRGSTSECGSGAICANVDGGLYCQPRCDGDRDCAPDEECSGVTGSDEKACKPDDPDDFDDDDDDGPPF